MKTERYAMIEIHAFGDGMRKLFEGVAEVFASMGVTDTAVLEKAKSQWEARHPQNDTGDQTASGEIDSEEAPAVEAQDGSDDSADETAAKKEEEMTPAEESREPEKEPKRKKAAKKEEKVSTVTQDDITKIIVQKIKKDRSNNEKIGELLKTYGIAKVSELPEEKYEAFLTDISAI